MVDPCFIWSPIEQFEKRVAVLHCPVCGKERLRTASGWCCIEPHSRLLPYWRHDESRLFFSQFPLARKIGARDYVIKGKLCCRAKIDIGQGKTASRVNSLELRHVPADCIVARYATRLKYHLCVFRELTEEEIERRDKLLRKKKA